MIGKEVDISLGRKVETGLCEPCKEQMKKVLTYKDLLKGARNVNHLLKIYNDNLCKECLAHIMKAGRKQ